MKNELVMPYPEIVRRLFKPDTMPRQYMHAAVGVVGEYIELLEARRKLGVASSHASYQQAILEELGDLAFYLQAALNFDNFALELFELVPKELDWHFIEQAGELMDAAKRFDIYNKGLEQERWSRHLNACVACFFAELRMAGVTLKQIQLVNQHKLLTGEKARYALGVYSDEQANARQDKVS